MHSEQICLQQTFDNFRTGLLGILVLLSKFETPKLPFVYSHGNMPEDMWQLLKNMGGKKFGTQYSADAEIRVAFSNCPDTLSMSFADFDVEIVTAIDRSEKPMWVFSVVGHFQDQEVAELYSTHGQTFGWEVVEYLFTAISKDEIW